jgi:hypothetical protein
MMSLTEILQTAEPDILIISGGPHFHSMEQFQGSMNAINQTILSVMEQVPQAKVILRGQHPGHVNCQTYTTPLETYTPLTEKDEYDWFLLPVFDQEMEKLVNYLNHPRISYWNTLPLYLRPDAHTYAPSVSEDCLHYALPGPLSFESNLLLTKLSTGEI